MRSTLLLSLFSIGLGACVVGCGDHGVPSPEDMAVSNDLSASLDMSGVIPDDAKRIVTFTMFAQDYAQAVCAHAMACGQLDAAQLSACLERNLLHTGWDQDVEIMKGRMEINELQCLDAIKSSRCDFSDVGSVNAKCQEFLYTGHQADGMPCIGGAECTSHYCQHGGSDAGMTEQVTGCAGVCAPAKSAGQTCRIGPDCAPGNYCARSLTPHQCVALTMGNASCTNILGKGTGQPCQAGLNCPTFSATPTCQLPAMQMALHGACDPYQGAATQTAACAPGLYCQVQYTATTTACTTDNQCTALSGYCDVPSGFCQAPSAGKCETKIAAAADCDPHNENIFSFVESQCVDGAVCAQLAGQTKATCQTVGGANANCNDDTNCKVGFYCSSGKCTAWLADNASCDPSTTGAECTSETAQTACVVANTDAGTSTTCQVTKSFGAACVPGLQDALCEPSDLIGSTRCAPNAAGTGGTCAPNCF